MNLSVWRRAFALIWAVFFLLNTAGESLGLQPCPFHVPTHDSELQDEHGSGERPPQTHSHAHHSGSGESPTPAGHSHSDPHHAQLCTHSDVCQVATASILPGDLDLGAVSALVTAEPSLSNPVEPVLAGLTPYFLPYPNGPPIRG